MTSTFPVKNNKGIWTLSSVVQTPRVSTDLEKAIIRRIYLSYILHITNDRSCQAQGPPSRRRSPSTRSMSWLPLRRTSRKIIIVTKRHFRISFQARDTTFKTRTVIIQPLLIHTSLFSRWCLNCAKYIPRDNLIVFSVQRNQVFLL